MEIKIPYPSKVVVGTILGIGASMFYIFKDHLVFYEVERKIINEDVAFEVEDKKDSDNAWTIRVKTADSEGWSQNEGYYWECTITGSNSLPIDKEALESKLPLSKGNLDSSKNAHKRRLISNCSRDRTESSHKKVKAKFAFSVYENSSNWASRLFGVKNFYKVENKIANENINLTVGEKRIENSSNSWTMNINSSGSESNSEWNENNGYYWECIISGFLSLPLEQTTLQNEFSSSGQRDNKKQKNIKNLVSVCSQNRQEESDTKVKSKFIFPKISTSENWKSYLFL